MKKSGSHKFLIDGFPRNQDNLDGWNRQMAANVNLLFVLFFDCPQEVRNLTTCWYLEDIHGFINSIDCLVMPYSLFHTA